MTIPGYGGLDPNGATADGGGAVDPGSTGGTGGSGGSGGTGGTGTDGGGASPPPPPAGAGIPCNIQTFLRAKCDTCHSDPPVNGSLAGLVTISDLMATSKEDPTKNEAQLSLARMQAASSPMPPSSVNNAATAAEISAFQTWVNGNYQGSCGTDAGAPPATVDPFAGAPAYSATQGNSAHNAGRNCMGGCHNHGFTFAGTLTDGAGSPVVGGEVRLVDANGKAISVHSGSDGNFYTTTSWTPPAHVGARTSSNKVIMVTALSTSSNGGCNGCHVSGGTTAPIHLP